MAFNGPARRKNGTRLVHVSLLFVWLVEWPVSCRYWPCTTVRVFFFNALSHEKATFFCLRGSLWRLFGSNTGENCTERSCSMYEKVMGWFWWSVVAIVALRFGCTCVLSCIPSGQMRRVFWHIKVSRRGQERVTSSQMVTTARPCICGRAWLRLERDCAMMSSFKGSEMVLRGGEFPCFSEYLCPTRPNLTCVVRRCGEFGRALCSLLSHEGSNCLIPHFSVR